MEQQTYDFGSYASFRDTVNELIDSLEQLKEYASSLQLDNTAKSIGDVIAKNAGEHFEVAIVGEFKRYIQQGPLCCGRIQGRLFRKGGYQPSG